MVPILRNKLKTAPEFLLDSERTPSRQQGPFLSTEVGLHSRLSLRPPWKATQLFKEQNKMERFWEGIRVSVSVSPPPYISPTHSLSQKGLLNEAQIWGATEGRRKQSVMSFTRSTSNLFFFCCIFFFFLWCRGWDPRPCTHEASALAKEPRLQPCARIPLPPSLLGVF